MISKKLRLRLESVESQTALELPDRETLQIVVVVTIGDVLSHNTINVNAPNINAATQICALVSAINALSDCEADRPLFCNFR